MKYALIGCGRVAYNHLKAAAENQLDLVAVCDICDANIDDLFARAGLSGAAGAGVRRYTDWKTLLRQEKPALVSIALPSGLHAACAKDVIRAGCSVIIEKPVALRLSDADELIALAKEYGVKAGACHQNRFNLAVQEMRGCLEEGRFGELSHAAITVRWSRGEDYYASADWRGTWEMDGGALMNQSIHGIDLLRWMCGNDLRRVSGVTKRQFHPYIEAEDVGMAVLEFANGCVATVEGSVNVYGPDMEEHLTLMGSRGAMKLGGTSANTVEYRCFADGAGAEKNSLVEQTSNVYGNGHTSLFGDVIAAIREDREPYVTLADGRRALETVLAIYLSSKTGRPVTLPLEDVGTADFTGLFD